MNRSIDIQRLSVLFPLLLVVLGMANPPNQRPEPPILGGFSADDSSISGIISECIIPNPSQGTCDLTIEVYTEAMTLLNAESVAAPNWTVGSLSPGTTYLLIARASHGSKTSFTGPYAYATSGELAASGSEESEELPYPGIIPANEHVGSIKGIFEVGSSGAALYQLAIIVPPGTAGLEPELAIQYHSQAGNGALGVGFRLTGLSEISRCPPTLFFDGSADPVDFDDNDRFCLDGQPLVVTNGMAYGANGAEYRTTIDTVAKVTSYGGSGNDPDRFEIREKGGRILSYGTTADSRIEVQGRSEKRAWALSYIIDRSGNNLAITYHEDSALGEYWPVEIAYTGRLAGGAPYNKVTFEYDGWATRPDVIRGFFAGGLVENPYRLTNIKTFARGDAGPASDLVFDYRIDYEVSPSTGVSRIHQITQCDSDDPIGRCLPPVTFSWSDDSADTLAYDWDATTFPPRPPPIASSDPNSDPFAVWGNTRFGSVVSGDFNGDGRTDLVRAAVAGVSDFPCAENSQATCTTLWIDDGAAISQGDGTYNFLEWVGAPFQSFDPRAKFLLREFTGDIDGDGRDDVIQVGHLNPRESSSSPIATAPVAIWTSTGYEDGYGFTGLEGTAGNISTSFPILWGWFDHYFQLSWWDFGVGDLNGDGLIDVWGVAPHSTDYDVDNPQYPTSQRYAAIYVAYSNGDGTFDMQPQLVTPWMVPMHWNVGGAGGTRTVLGHWQAVDVNGDGVDDIVGVTGSQRDHPGAQQSGPSINTAISTGTGFEFMPQQPIPSEWGAGGLDTQQGFWTPLEINGDGQADLVFLDREADIYSAPGSTRFHTALSRGDGSYQIQTTPWLPAGGSGLALPYYFYGSEEPDQQDELPNAVMYAHDPDGDGRDQLVILGGKGSTNANGRWDIPFHADGTLDTSGPFYDFDSSSSYPYGMCNTLKWSDQYSEYGEFPGDHDGDGRLEWICWRVLVETWQGYADSLEVFTTTPIAVDPSAPDPFAAALARPLPNLITSIANGADDATLDPHETAISYRPLTDSTIYDRGPSLGYPLRAIQDGRRVVSWYSVSDGVGGLRTFDYFYTGLRIHLGLHESFGFSDIELWDAAAGIAKQTSYNQVFPIQRTSLRTESYQLGSDLLIESTDHYWMGDELVFSGGSVFAARELQTLTRSYGIDTTPEPPHRSAVETFDYDAYGNVRQEGHYWAEGDLTPFPVPDSTLQALHQEVTTTIYDPPDFVNWFVDQIDRRSVTAQLTGAGGASLTRTTAFDYDANGRLATQILEPDGAPPDELWVRQQTDWTYDAFGNVATRTVGGGVVGQVDRTQTTIWDSRGQFPVTLENAMHHQTQVEYEPRHGKRLWAEDPNGVRTDWQYDALGRETREIRADGTETVSYYSRCDASCWPEAGASPYVKTSIASDGALAIRYNDLLGRAILDETNSFLGSPVLVMTAFDSLGRIVGHSRPNWVGWMPYFAVTTHDLLGRALTQTTPDGHVTSYAYLGLEAEVTDPRGYTRVTESNARGWIVRSTDPKQESMLYEHDPFGNVTSAWRAGDQSATEVITSYDLYGRRKTLADPNAGSWAGAPPWQWMYNFFGEVITSTDPKGQLALFFYDGLGRRTDRLEPDGQTTTWTYDTSPSGIGKLASIDGPYQYERSLSYDALGRLMHTSHLIDQTYFASNVTYDSDGRVDKLIYPSGFGVEHEYNAQGDLLKLTESLSGDPIWTKISAEVDGQTRTVSLGNGVSSNRFHDVVTGRLVSLWDRVRPPGEPSTLLQYREVTFDPMGNLTERFDVRLWVVETMDYDELNRLTEVRSSIWDSPPSSTGSFTYDALGNLKSKTGVGTYTYAEGAGPHAVTQLDPGPGAVTRHYGYDWNGNMTCRGSLNPAICNGTVIDYTWFDKPSLIVTPSGAQSAFTYDADHARIRQVATANGNTTTTRYVGKTYESVVKDGVTEKVHHIFADGVAVAQYIDHEGGAPDAWRYLHRDHLGSTIATSDENGALVQRIDFEPHGQRIARDASYQTESPELPRGFTGHEHLEDVGLIHMNGRVYDPELGRMLSVDPFVVAPLNLQTYNRYSYVHNNPLSLTDPSGYYTSPAQAESVASSKPKTSITSKGQPKGNESGVSDKRDAEANKALSNGKTLVYTLANGSKVEVSGTGTVQHNGETGEVTISGNLSVAGLANSEAGVALQLTPGSTTANPASGSGQRIIFTGPSSQGEDSYIASRPALAENSGVSHNFIVTDAEYPGDPNANVISHGNNAQGKIGRVDGNTTGFSQGTYADDVAAWEGFKGTSPNNSNLVKIPASSAAVRTAAGALIENQDYSAIAGPFGANSSSAAQAVANRAAGLALAVPGAPRLAPGAGSWREIQFRE